MTELQKSRAAVTNEMHSLVADALGAPNPETPAAAAGDPPQAPERRQGKNRRTLGEAADSDTLEFRQKRSLLDEPEKEPTEVPSKGPAEIPDGSLDPTETPAIDALAEAAGAASGDTEDDSEEITSLNQLPKALGWEAEDFYSLELKLSDNKSITLGEAKDALQQMETRERDIRAEEMRLRDQAKAFEAQVAQKAGQVQQTTERQQKAEQTITFLRNKWAELSENWKTERLENPGKVSLEQSELERAFQAAQQEHSAAVAESTQIQEASKQQYLREQNQILLAGDPRYPNLTPIKGWEDAEKRPEIQKAMRDTARSFGVTDAELAEMNNARALRMLWAVTQWVQHEQEAGKVAKKLSSVPKGKVARGTRVKKGANKDGRLRVAKAMERAQAKGARQADKRAALDALVAAGLGE